MDHRNLHYIGGGTQEVADSVRRDYKRDSKWVQINDVFLAIGILWLVRHWEYLDGLALFVAVFTGITGLRMFIDQSNRNFWLHSVNFDSERRREAVEADNDRRHAEEEAEWSRRARE